MATALEEARNRLAEYRACEARILSTGQASAVGSRNFRFADLGEIRKAIKELQSEIAVLEDSASGVSSLITVVPR